VSKDFVREAESILGSRVVESGKVLYSPTRTLAEGDVYLLGSNPGGRLEYPESRSIQENLCEFQDKQTNDFFCERWRNKRGRLLDPGEHYLQRRLQRLFHLLDLNLYETCSSNLIFMRSPQESGVPYTRDADDCWKVHLLILARVMPKVVLVFGCGAPFDYLWRKLGNGVTIESLKLPRYSVKAFSARHASRDLKVVGFPHPSRHAVPEGSRAVSWISDQLNEVL
jgi:hypothetical protein